MRAKVTGRVVVRHALCRDHGTAREALAAERSRECSSCEEVDGLHYNMLGDQGGRMRLCMGTS